MNIRRVLAVTGMGLVATCAQAGITFNVSAPGALTTSQAGATTVNFNDGTCGAYTFCAGNGALVTGSLSGRYASPLGISDRYLSIPYHSSSGQVTLETPGSFNYFGLYWGSVDTYNSIAFYSGESFLGSFSGSSISPPLLADGNQTAWTSNRYVNFLFTNGAAYNRIVMTSTNYAFESDNHAFGNVSVPEPAMFTVLGLGLIGFGIARRKRNLASAS